MEKIYDLLVIGWGKAGKTLSAKISTKGKKTDISKHAEIHGESLNGFINRAITQTIESDNTSQEGA